MKPNRNIIKGLADAVISQIDAIERSMKKYPEIYSRHAPEICGRDFRTIRIGLPRRFGNSTLLIKIFNQLRKKTEDIAIVTHNTEMAKSLKERIKKKAKICSGHCNSRDLRLYSEKYILIDDAPYVQQTDNIINNHGNNSTIFILTGAGI